MMLGFPPLMYYLWTCLVFYDGKLVGPKSLSVEDIKGFLFTFYSIAKTASLVFTTSAIPSANTSL